MNKTPEQKARDNIDRMLERSGWAVVDKNDINWSLGPGIAVREYQTDVGRQGGQIVQTGLFEWGSDHSNILK